MQLRQNHDGFTIIEVLIAIAIFSIGFLAVAGMQVSALNSTTSSRVVNDALEIAASRVEHLHGLPLYDRHMDLNGDGEAAFFDIHPDFEAGTHEDTDSSGRYTIRWTVIPDEPLEAVDNVWTSAEPSEITVSKTIRVSVAETRNPGKNLAEMEMIKIWGKDG